MKTSLLYKLSIYLILILLTSGLSRATLAQPNLSLKQKVGQIFIFGYPGTSLSAEATRLLSQVQPGGLIAFGRHIKSFEQIGRFNQELQRLAKKNSKVPVLLMVDQEGGAVTRIHLSAPSPSALALGQIGNDAIVEEYGVRTGELLSALGFQMNLAPVLDLSDPNSKTFIGNRSFGSNASAVSHTSTIYARGLAKAGIIPTAKHFPGHGGLSQDSHHMTPSKLTSVEELSASDLKPFVEFGKIDFPKAVMLGHVSLPNADPSGLPATFSSFILNDLLRTRVGFTGLAITDDVEMSGAAIAGSLGERVVRAFEAGNDMIMVAGSTKAQMTAYSALLAAVRSGRISRTRLDESVQRILVAKRTVKPFAFNRALAAKSARQLSHLSGKVAEENFERASVNSAPLNALRGFYSSDQDYLVFSSDPRFFNAFRSKIPKRTKLLRLTPNSLSRVNALLKKNPQALAVYYASGLQTARWLERISSADKSRLIVINTNHAAAIERQSEFKAVFNINTPAPSSGAWLAEFLSFAPVREPAEQASAETSH